MRIIHIIDYFQPQLGYQETFLPNEQAKLGHDVYVVTSDRYKPSLYVANREVLGRRVVGAGFFVEESIRVWRLETLFEIPHQIWIRGLEKGIRELAPHVVVVHGIVNLFAIRVALLKKKTGAFKLIYDDHMTFDNSTSTLRILYPLFHRTFSHLIQETADAFVAVGSPCKAFMHQKYGIPPERITVIPLGADDELFRFDPAARREVRNELGLREEDVVFAYTGKVIPQKRLDLLVEALSLMRDHSNAKALVVGSGSPPYVDAMKRKVEASGLGDRFIWRDAVINKELPRYYSAADVAVWPRGASIGQREAMACGLPIIISQGSMVTELVDHNNGLVSREDDAAHLAQQMAKLLDPQLRRQMGANSRKYVEDKLNWRVIARQFIGLVP